MNVADSHARKGLRSSSKDAVRAAQRRWLDDVMAATGKTLSRIADDAGRPGTTLTRFFNDTGYSGTLSAPIVQAISEVTGIAGPGAVLPTAVMGCLTLRDDGSPFDGHRDAGIAAAVQALIRNAPDVSAWTMKSGVLQLAGVREGDVLIIDQAADPHDGDIVCAQIEIGLGAKTVFRAYQRPMLIGAAVDVMAVRPEIVDGVRVRIAGVMISMLRSRT